MKAVIFDMDGVIIDSEPVHRAVERDAFAVLGIELTPAEHAGFLGVGWGDMIAEVNRTRNRSITMVEYRGVVATVRDRHVPPGGMPFVPGAVDLIVELGQMGAVVGIASSSHRASITETVQRGGVESVVAAYTGGDEVHRSKPAPALFLETASRLSRAPGQCVVIEDSPNGVRAARAAGMACIGYRNPGSGSPDLGAATVVCDTIGAVRTELFRLIGASPA